MRIQSYDVRKITIFGSVERHLFLDILDINYGGAKNIFFKVNTYHLGGYGGVWGVSEQTDLIGVINFFIVPVVFLFGSVKEL